MVSNSPWLEWQYFALVSLYCHYICIGGVAVSCEAEDTKMPYTFLSLWQVVYCEGEKSSKTYFLFLKTTVAVYFVFPTQYECNEF